MRKNLAMSPPKECHFCGATEGLVVCTWLCEKPVKIGVQALTVDDRIVTRGGRHLQPLTVRTFSYGNYVRFVMYALDYGRDRVFLFYRDCYETVTALRIARCQRWVCDLHRAERGTNSVCCMEHWHEWRKVA